jgi:hypothetical protein
MENASSQCLVKNILKISYLMRIYFKIGLKEKVVDAVNCINLAKSGTNL